jgi:hypothetical protein
MNWSKVDVLRAIPAFLCRGLVFLVTIASCFLMIGRDSRAAGCHVPDRPMPTSKLPWELELATDLATAPPVQVPPILTHPPCPGEVPRLLEPTGVFSAAQTHQRIGLDPAGLSQSVPVHDPSDRSQPPSNRLDRPPRHTELCVIVALAVERRLMPKG